MLESELFGHVRGAFTGAVDEAIASYEKYLVVKPDVTDADLVRTRIEQPAAT